MSSAIMHLLDELQKRGLLHQQTHAEQLREHLTEPRAIYCGFDPTKDSLTIGNLVPLVLLARFQRAGHRPVVVMGGGTGLIGDPSGKEAERPMLTPDDVERNVQKQRPIFERVLDFSGSHPAKIVNNADWLGQLGYLEMLRDIGKHFSVNMMIQKDSVRERLQSREQGISYTEFSYMLLQAYDYLHLFDNEGVTVQAAGSDQWGNIVAGMDLIRRLRQKEAFGLTAPLVTKSDGGKFGKTESGAIWLTAERTSPYAFYQFWLNASDADAEQYLKIFTLLDLEQIEQVMEEHRQDPAGRAAQRCLARHMTELLHGSAERERAEQAGRALFSGEIGALDNALLDEVLASAPSGQHSRAELGGEGKPLVDLLVETKLASSKRQAREFLSNGAVTVNGQKAGADQRIGESDLLHGSTLVLRRGKKAWHVTRWS